MMSFSIGRMVLVLLAVWLVVIILLSGPLFHSNEPDEQLLARLTRAVGELEALKQQNEELHALLTSLKSPVMDGKNKDTVKSLQNVLKQFDQNAVTGKPSNACRVPSLDFEQTRRRVDRGIQEWWYYLNSELRKLNGSLSDKVATSQAITLLLEDSTGYKRTVSWDLKRLSELDGLGDWRAREAKELASLLQHRISTLQNPKDCRKARKLVCNLNKGCGYGCQLHHVTYCMIVAYGTQRTLVLHSRNWRYSKEGWEAIFQPLSKTCLDDSGLTRDAWPGTDDTQVLDLPIVDNVKPKPVFLPLDIPKDISERLMRFHGNPGAWWIGQFVHYLCRPQSHLVKMVEEAENSLGFQSPIVGVHVRRTDKIGTEASYHDLAEYMGFVDLYYRALALKQTVDVRRVYLATDDSGLLAEARRRFQDYTFLGDADIAKSASMANRYSTASLRGVILDINMLAKCDYLVCTFSSQVCRVAYEVMQTLHPDASNYVHSLDDIFYFGGQKDHNQVALYDHHPQHPNQIELKRGDVVGIAGNHWDGFSKGINRRTYKSGLYPSYKVREKVDTIQFASYAEIDKSWQNPFSGKL